MSAPHNYALAFIRYCQGDTVETIAETLQIPVGALQAHCYGERWAQLRQESLLPVRIGESSTEVETRARVDLIKRNREENFQIACALRRDLQDAIGRLSRGEKLKRYFFAAKAVAVVEHDVDWSLADRVALANYAQMIANIGYQALGDSTNSSARSSDGPVNAQSAPHITVILPGLISEPREKRAKGVNVNVEATVTPTIGSGVCGAPPETPQQVVGKRADMETIRERVHKLTLVNDNGAGGGAPGPLNKQGSLFNGGGAPANTDDHTSDPCVIDLRPLQAPAAQSSRVTPPSCPQVSEGPTDTR